MTIRHPRILAIAAAAGLLAVSAPASAAPATAPTTTRSPAAAAAGWLAQQFAGAAGTPTPDGDHFNFAGPAPFFLDGGGTADAIYALAAAKAGKAKIDTVISFLKVHVDDYVDITNADGFGPNDGGIAKVALAAMVAGADPTSFGVDPVASPAAPLNLLQHLKVDECPAGATTCIPGSAANIFSSVAESFVILAEARTGGSFAPSTAAVTYFLSLQCPNGGFTDGTTACAANSHSSVDQTGYAVAALLALGGHPTEIDSAVAWLISQRNPAGYWMASPPVVGPNVSSTGLAVSALDATGADVSTSRVWLASQQVRTGPTIGAGATRGAFTFNNAPNRKTTSDGMLGLVPGSSLATLTSHGATDGTAVLALDTPKTASASVAQSGHQTVTGLGFGAGETVAAVLNSTPVSLGTVTASAVGTAIVAFTVPANLPVGTHTVVLTGVNSGLTSTATFAVIKAVVAPVAAPPVAVDSGGIGLANSGLDGQQTLEEALVGLGLILAGAGALFLGRRRRT